MQLVKWASGVRGPKAGPRAEASAKCQNEIETKGQPASGRAPYLPITLLGFLLVLLLPAHKKRSVVRTKSAGV